MEDKKQELLKLIDNLDWDKFVDLGCSGLSVYSYAVALLCDNQKEKTIEQLLEELGFKRWTYMVNGLNYLDCDDGVLINVRLDLHSNIDKGALLKWDKNDHKTILSFANYLINLKRGDNQ